MSIKYCLKYQFLRQRVACYKKYQTLFCKKIENLLMKLIAHIIVMHLKNFQIQREDAYITTCHKQIDLAN